ncbi:MAG TPA: Bax inhibitor-1/YccA family protein [Flavobacteriales bacterium]
MNSIENYSRSTEILDFTQDASVQKKFFSSVFTYMAIGLGISAVTSFYLGQSIEWFQLLFTETGISGLGYVIMLSPLAFTLFANRLMANASTTTLALVFSAFAVVMGMSISTIFLIYSLTSIATIFLVTAGTFALFAFLGYTTKTDLTKIGTIAGIGLFALIAVNLLNFFFFKSEQVSYWSSGIGVLIVVALIAYHMQYLKHIAAGLEYGDTTMTKRALIGAFALYISFINLFMMLLRLFGNRE